ncbi:hypothetical protein PENANT_c001G11483 [Penicillium antarcticum]|uniref:Uncharacterized protein n=1 Tax=Penicillium antarcticum TaxID=416450 RepID=A0A1V6QMI7_9EURO|nr:uncharacterized protein N7508_010348 [Penicillium antarcticum]KAJ5295527.1 hypothetical protein N7508_010348 [Penicillium antarcticum]OQD90395.1 hypothetical protein PENANT_c001G11483 [Penicillium antarcticum]
MHSIASLGPGDLTPFPNPGVRRIGFGEDPPQFTVAHLLIHGWAVQRLSECNDPPIGDFKIWAKEVDSLSPKEREELPRDSDLKSCHTLWRDQIYYMWNHVFYDVGNWMANTYGTGTFKPPNTEVFPIEFPKPHENGDGEKKPVATKVWDTETLLAPAYLAPGVSLRVETFEPGQENGEPFHPADFNHKDRYNVWYVKKGLQMRFYVEGDWDQSTDGVAAVMVYGNMLGEPFKFVDEESEESEEDENGEHEE